MAYVDAQKTKDIRAALKAEFPNVKFSVRKEGHISLNVTVLESPYFDDGVHSNVNQYYIHSHFEGAPRDFLKKVDEIIRKAGEWWDKSDIMTDYFNTAFYYHIQVGSWDKPHVKKGDV